MGNNRRPRRKELVAWLQSRAAANIDEAEAAALQAAFPRAGQGTLRHALLDSGLPLSPLVEGVRQDSFDHLERTLATLAAEYQAADRAGAKARRAEIRRIVITARRHAAFAAANQRLDETRRGVKREMHLWIHTWLENPPLFPTWLALRKRVLAECDAGSV